MQNELNKKRREANQLNARIDRLIAEEIEKARKRAAEEARREAAARKRLVRKPKNGNCLYARKAEGTAFGNLLHE